MDNQILKNYNLKNITLKCKSNYGIIYEVISEDYNKLIVKINLDKKNYHDSCKYYTYFKNMKLCKMYDNDDKNNIQLLEYINGDNLFCISDFNKRIKLGYDYFYNWSKKLITINNDKDISFERQVNVMIDSLKNMSLSSKVIKLVTEFEKRAKHFFKTYNNSYLLHGDLHHYNMLYDGKTVTAIDLSPRQASFAIEIAKFIENELFNNIDNIFQTLNTFLLIYKFEIISCDELLEGLFIDSCYRTFDTFIENKCVSELEKGIYMNYEILKFMESRAWKWTIRNLNK